MNKSLVVGLVAGIGIATAVGAVAGYQRYSAARFAEVVDVKPATKTVKEPRQVCSDEQVVRQAPVKDRKQVTGTVAGALVGGILGNQIGGGSGKTIATVAGAAAGGYAGNRVQKQLQENDRVVETERRCTTVYDRREQQVGYDVTYLYDGRTTTVRMDHHPGPKLPVRDGQVLLTKDASAS
jgi:uncharacterized protein YcfJ